MEQLKYIVEDSAIAELLGVQNFTTVESAILELVKNSYDACAKKVVISFGDNILSINDDGIGMDKNSIRQNWMHVGRSNKKYSVLEGDGERVLAGSKGIGRFALARLGASVVVCSVKDKSKPVKWTTNWDKSTLDDWDNCDDLSQGTRITICNLRDRWTERKIANLAEYLSISYNDDKMKVIVEPNDGESIFRYFEKPKLGKNCVSKISLEYDKERKRLSCAISSDEFNLDAKKYCTDVDLHYYSNELNILDELVGDRELDLCEKELERTLNFLGNFTSEFYFSLKASTPKEIENFMYKYDSINSRYEKGVVLYRNAFSISSFDGKRDWLGFGKRSRKSPAAATHASGAWKVRENQISGKVIIDKRENNRLKELSNRQGLEEDVYYQLFIKIILIGISEFERYRQSIIRLIDKKNKHTEKSATDIIDQILENPTRASSLSTSDTETLRKELEGIKKESNVYKEEKKSTEERYKYDVRILNVLATSGLKGTSIAHELKNDRNSISVNYDYIVTALKEYRIWDDLNSPELTKYVYKNVPRLLQRNKDIGQKLLVFMDTMLDGVERQKFDSKKLNIYEELFTIKENWERDYAWLEIELDIDDELYFDTSQDVFAVIFDNLILNSLQQNEQRNKINIRISIKSNVDGLNVNYCDDGIGLPKKFVNDPMRILIVHETSKKNGHGLGMWIVNNTVLMTGGFINKIDGREGFKIYFELGAKL